MRLVEAKKASMLQNHPLKVLMPINGLSSELYLRVTMSSSRYWNHNSPNTIHHFCLAYGSNEEILDYHPNKLNQELDEA